ncbi:MAG: hypothetical protein JSU68_07575 [Phycisphaerales bacterium]|nr:MAG: hypothetical protein JSU68_07575 [Phycisphaerales bacterium]
MSTESLLLWGVLGAAVGGCADTQEDLQVYLFGSGGMESLLAEESAVIEQFNEQVNKDPESEERAKTVAGLLRRDILPAYNAVLERMRRLEIRNKKIRRLHEEYLEITAGQKETFEELLALLEAEEIGSVVRVNLHLAKLRNRRTDWRQTLRQMCADYEVARPDIGE